MRIYSIAKSGVSATRCRVCVCVSVRVGFMWMCVCIGCSTTWSTLRTEMQGISKLRVCVCVDWGFRSIGVCVYTKGRIRVCMEEFVRVCVTKCFFGVMLVCVCDLLFRRNSCVCELFCWKSSCACETLHCPRTMSICPPSMCKFGVMERYIHSIGDCHWSSRIRNKCSIATPSET